MAAKKSNQRRSTGSARPSTTDRHAESIGGRQHGTAQRRPWVIAAAIAVVVVGAISLWAVASLAQGKGGSATAGTPTGTGLQQAGGPVTNISADELAVMLTHRDFTLLNVKTPYIGEIDGTDLYIPYTDLAARASSLPADKSAKIVVYCRSGAESAVAAQVLVGLGYTNIDNLDGGMNAWQAGGRSIVQRNRG